MAKALVLFLWIFNNYATLKGVSLPGGTADRTTVCNGVALRGSCTSGEVIAVQHVSYGTKLTSTCSLSSTSAGCCNYGAGDCFLPDYTDTAQQAACSGRELCTDVTVAQADTTSCGATYPVLNHYLTMQYHCIEETRIAPMCSSSTKSNTGSLLYLWNRDYPSAIRSTDTSCSCSVEVTSCSSQIKVYLLQLTLSDGGGPCTGTQQIHIDDNGSVQTLICSDNTDYEITLKSTSSSNYITVTMDNPAGINGGYFWIGFEETSGSVPLTVNCPAVARTMCMDCSGLSRPPNGQVSPTTAVSTGQTATYTCNMGFNMIGSNTRTCQPDGNWSGTEPVCGNCPSLAAPDNGAVSATGSTAGETATYTCSSGYVLTGSTTRTCQADNTWSGSEPTCTARALGDSCTVEGDCNSVISSSTCEAGTCRCAGGYKEENNACVDDSGGGLSGGAVAGIVVGVLVGIAVVPIVTLVIIKKPWRTKNNGKVKPNDKQTANGNISSAPRDPYLSGSHNILASA